MKLEILSENEKKQLLCSSCLNIEENSVYIFSGKVAWSKMSIILKFIEDKN